MVALGAEEHGSSGTHAFPRTALHHVAAVVTTAQVSVLGGRGGHVRVPPLVYLGFQSTPDTLTAVRPGVGGWLS